MFSIFKKKINDLVVPDWASFFKQNEYAAFIKAIDDYFYNKNVTYTLGVGMINVGPNDFEFSTLGLTNVAQVCNQAEISDYSEIINNHFDALLKTNQFDKEFIKIIDDYEKAKQYLAVRIYSDEYVSYGGIENKIIEKIADDLNAALVFDLPDSIESVLTEQATKWGKSNVQLFEAARTNIKNNYINEISKEQLADIEIWFAQGEHFFVPNIILELANMPQLVGSHGSLVGIPHRHAVIIYPIENLEVVNAVNLLIPVIHGMYKEGPGSVNDNLFWYNDSVFENLPYHIEDNKIQFNPSEDFVDVLNRLSV